MKLISLRVPDELLCRVEAQAKTERRSRSQMLVKLLEDLYADLRGTGVEPTGQTERTRNRATVPVLPKAKGSAKPVALRQCATCGSMNGMHQKGCTAK